jgi:hypothetical protein
MSTAIVNVLKPCAFNAEFQYFIPLFEYNFVTLRITARRGMKHQMRGATQAQQGMTFMDNSLLAANVRNRISMQPMRSRTME